MYKIRIYKGKKVEELIHDPELQMKLYQSRNMNVIKHYLKIGCWFCNAVLHKMIETNDIAMLKIYLKRQHFCRSERIFMLKKGSMEFIETYLSHYGLSTAGGEFIKNPRFSDEFISAHKDALTRVYIRQLAEVRPNVK